MVQKRGARAVTEKSALNIDKIRLHNYRTYLGTHELAISSDPSKPVTIIHGSSGLGKTTILNATHWAFYGTERVQLDARHTNEGLVNKHALERLALNDSTETFVELWLADEDGLAYRIKRTIKALKSSDIPEQRLNTINASLVSEGIYFQSQLTVHYRSDSTPQLLKIENTDAQIMIENVFPKQLSSYILFDGELLNQFLNRKEEDLVKQGIEEISGLPLIDTAISNLKKTDKRITQELKDQLPFRALIEQLESLDTKRAECEQDRDEKITQFRSLQKAESEYRDYLNRHPVEMINERYKQLKEIENSEKELIEKIATLLDQFRNFLCENNYKLRLRTAIMSAEKKFQQWEQDDLIPPAISKPALDQMINSTPPTCICGRPLAEGSPELIRLQQMQERIIDSTMIQEIMHGRSRLSIVLESINRDKIGAQYSYFSTELAIARQKLSGLTTSKKAIMTELKSNSDIKARQVSADLDQNRRDQTEVTLLIGEADSELKSIKSDYDEIQKKVFDAKNIDDKNTAILQKTNLCKISVSLLQQIRTDLLDEFKIKTEHITSDYFLKIAPRKEDFAEVKIAPDFQLKALDKQGRSKLLSAGQSHCLGLSYIAAIRAITKQNYFIIIDSPLHNISQEAKVQLAELFPHYLQKTQLTLLVTDQEYSGIAPVEFAEQDSSWSKSVRDVLKDNNCIWKEYKLVIKKDPNNNTYTEICEVAQ